MDADIRLRLENKLPRDQVETLIAGFWNKSWKVLSQKCSSNIVGGRNPEIGMAWEF